VGKSSLVRRYLSDTFQPDYTATVGVDMKPSMVDFPDGRVVMSIVDLGGQESFTSLRNRFYQGSHHVILVYDVTNRETFDAIPKWYESLNQGVCLPEEVALGGTLVGNKVDVTEKIVVDTEEGQQLADLLSLAFFETSAATGKSVAELFIHAASSCREFSKQLNIR
jgi:small GTP-binding protein